MSYLTDRYGAEAAPEVEKDLTPEQRRYQAQLLKLAIGAFHAIGITNKKPYFKNGTGLYFFAGDFRSREGKDIERYEELTPLSGGYLKLLERLPSVIDSAFSVTDNGFPVIRNDGAEIVADHLRKILNHPDNPIAAGAVPPTHARKAQSVRRAEVNL